MPSRNPPSGGRRVRASVENFVRAWVEKLSNVDQLFGRIATMKGWLSQAQLQRALRFQEEIRSLGLKKTVGQILRDDGVLDDEQVAQILRLQAVNQRAQYERRFGRIALKNGLITPTQLEVALQVAETERFQRSLGTILEEAQALDSRTARAVHAAMERAQNLQGAEVEEPQTSATGRLARAIDMEGEEGPEGLEQRISDTTFAAIALREGLVLVPELERALAEQAVRDEEKPSLAEVLRERGILSTSDVETVQAALEEARNETLTIPGFELTDVLGYGITSIVLGARHGMTERDVAIKLFRPEHMIDTADALVEEAKAVAKIRHPNVVGLYEVGRVHRRMYFVMELVDGPTLADVIRRQPLSEADALRVASDVARGLVAIHAAGLVHRDVKPLNILLTSGGQAKLTDLGLVTRADDVSSDMPGAIYGSPHTISPEQANGDPVDARADLYGLGATLYYAVTGEPPYDGKDMLTILMAHVSDPIPDPRVRRPDLSDELAVLIRTLMSKSAEDRPSSAEEVLGHLEGMQAFSS